MVQNFLKKQILRILRLLQEFRDTGSLTLSDPGDVGFVLRSAAAAHALHMDGRRREAEKEEEREKEKEKKNGEEKEAKEESEADTDEIMEMDNLVNYCHVLVQRKSVCLHIAIFRMTLARRRTIKRRGMARMRKWRRKSPWLLLPP